MNKLEFINSYIKRCDDVIASNDYNSAKSMQTEIISTFEDEINNIRNELDNYSLAGFYQSQRKVDYVGDLKLLKKKLENYYFNIQSEEAKREHELEIARLSQPLLTAKAEATQTVHNNVHVSISVIIESIDKFSDDVLSIEDKDKIKEFLYSMEGIKASKDKNKFWEKAKGLIKYIMDKGIDVAIAVLPYILGGLQ